MNSVLVGVVIVLTVISGGFTVAKMRKHVNIVLRERLNLSLPTPPTSTPKKKKGGTIQRLNKLRKCLFPRKKKSAAHDIEVSGFNKTEETVLAEGGDVRSDDGEREQVQEGGAVGGGGESEIASDRTTVQIEPVPRGVSNNDDDSK